MGEQSVKPYRGYDGTDGPRVAIAHDYVTRRGGAERVVLSMSKAFRNAPVHTLLFDPRNTHPEFANRDVRVSGFAEGLHTAVDEVVAA